MPAHSPVRFDDAGDKVGRRGGDSDDAFSRSQLFAYLALALIGVAGTVLLFGSGAPAGALAVLCAAAATVSGGAAWTSRKR